MRGGILEQRDPNASKELVRLISGKPQETDVQLKARFYIYVPVFQDNPLTNKFH